MKILRLLALNKQSVDSLLHVGCCSSGVFSSKSLSLNASSIESDLTVTQRPSLGGWVSVKELFEARVHLGHCDGSLDPRMTPYIWGSRLGHTIIDLDITIGCLRRALEVIKEITTRKGIVLFVSSAPSCTLPVENAAKQMGEFAHARPWRQGTLTNSTMIFGAVTRLPDLIVSVGQHPALVEAAKMAIPTIAVVDTNCDPSLVTYPIPGNDDTPCAIQLYLKVFSTAVALGKSSAIQSDAS